MNPQATRSGSRAANDPRSVRRRVATASLAALLLSLGAQAVAQPAGDPATGWIGKIVPPYPRGTVEQQGTCIGTGDAVCRHKIDVLLDPQSGIRTVLLVEEVPHFGDGPLGRVVDGLEFVGLDEALQFAVGLCQRGGRDDGRVLAVVDPRTETEWFDAPLHAWRADPATGRLQPLAVDGVRCRNEGFGYDG